MALLLMMWLLAGTVGAMIGQRKNRTIEGALLACSSASSA